MADKQKNINEIKQIFETTDILSIEEVIEGFRTDSRSGVKKLIASYENKLKKYHEEVLRLQAMVDFDRDLLAEGDICGIDEVGRGPLAGPVVTAAVIMPPESRILYVDDSKKLTQAKREELYELIMNEAYAVSFGIKGVEEVDTLNILQATLLAMSEAVNHLEVIPDLIIADAVTIPDTQIKQVSVIKGDEKSYSVACASIVAKVTRDRMMIDYHELFPNYGFDANKGYGAAMHIEALKKYGPCPIHRRTFIKNFI